MSTKSYRLVLEERERMKAKEEESVDSSDGEETTVHKKNLFELLDDDSENEDARKEVIHSAEETSTKKKTKRKNKKKKMKEPPNRIEEDEDIDSIIKEVSELPSCSHGNVSQDTAFKTCFTVELRHLNPDNEIKKLFGNRVLLNEKKKKRERNLKKYQLITPKHNIEVLLRKSGLSMDIVKRDQAHMDFVFVHSRAYQEAQKKFTQAVQSNHHENLIKLVESYPFHVDGLQQLSELFRMQEDMQQAAESIEHALFVFEASFHPLFSLSSGTSRLDYRRKENRSFFLVLFRHIYFLANKSLHRTALEVAKVVLSLSPDSDPLGILLMLDHLCLKSDQLTFLTSLYEEWRAPKNLFQLPNFAFSTPLAHYLIASSDGSKGYGEVSKQDSLRKADNMLREALLMYPHFLLRLLEKCAVQPDKDVSSHTLFNNDSLHKEPAALRMLVDLYVWRSHELWKEGGVMEWLERNVRVVVDGWTVFEATAAHHKKLRLGRYKGPPRNIYRHIIISEARGVADIPILEGASINGYDPLPPPDSIQAYDSSPREGSRRESNSSLLSLFLQSLYPSFNHNEAFGGDDDDAGGDDAAGGDDDADDAAGGGGGGRRGWLGGLVRQMIYNRDDTNISFFRRLYNNDGNEDDDGNADNNGNDDDNGNDDGDDNDRDVPRSQNQDDDNNDDTSGGASGGDGVRRRILNRIADDHNDVDDDNDAVNDAVDDDNDHS